MPSPIAVPALAARRFALQALGLEQPFATIEAALHHLGYVQIDPLNICGRMHDLILRNRVAGYREGDLMRHVHGGEMATDEPETGGNSQPTSTPRHASALPNADRALPGTPRSPKHAEERTVFEHHHPVTDVLVAFPLEAWPHLRAAMRGWERGRSAWSGRLTPTERALAPRLLEEIRTRGPMSSDDFADRRRAHRSVWGKSSLVKTTLQKLFFHGELLIADRPKHRRRYDLPERVLPARIVALPELPPSETARWCVLLKLRQRRLVTLTRAEFSLVTDAVQPLSVQGCPVLYCLKEDAPTLDAVMRAEPATEMSAGGPVRLLAPLDPLIYDRRLTRALWNFDYTWEAYTPPAKRVRGHYALPVLAGTELIGHVEPKADRANGKVVVASRSIRRGYRVGEALDELAAWLGLRR